MSRISGTSRTHGNGRLGVMLVLIAVLLAVRISVHRMGQFAVERVTTAATTRGMQEMAEPASPATAEASFPGDAMLEHYGDPAMLPQEDLIRLAHALENFALLAKQDHLPATGTNEELSAALRGHNQSGVRFLPDAHAVFNARGLLADRWGTPLFFHAHAGGSPDIRSAGPDKVMGTGDDLHRLQDGTFLHGAELEAAKPDAAVRSGRDQ